MSGKFMILGCPNCKTCFNVPDGALGADGRKVRCASCRHVWLAKDTDALVAKPTPVMAQRPTAQAAHSESSPQTPVQTMRPEPPVEVPDDPEAAAAAAALRRSLLAEEVSEAPTADDSTDGPEISVDETDFSYNDDTAEPLDHEETDVSLDDGLNDDDLDNSLDDVFEDDEDDEDVADRFRDRRASEAGVKRRKALLGTALWIALALVWLGLPTAFFLFPEKVQALWPASTVLYDKMRTMSDVERFREAGENLSPAITDSPTIIRALLEPTTVEERDGVTSLVLKGFVENGGARSARVPKLRAAILDLQGNVLDSWVFDPPGLIITRGQKLRFEQVRSPIPAGANQAVIETVEGAYSETEAPDQ